MEVSAQIGSLTLKEPFVIARDTTTEAEVVWVEIEHEGERGYGEANPIDRYEESAESALAYVEEVADSLGDDPFAFEEIESRLPERELAARAAIDAALHDLCGKLTGCRSGASSGSVRQGRRPAGRSVSAIRTRLRARPSRRTSSRA